jgi:hypothetical protein
MFFLVFGLNCSGPHPEYSNRVINLPVYTYVHM